MLGVGQHARQQAEQHAKQVGRIILTMEDRIHDRRALLSRVSYVLNVTLTVHS